MQPTLWNRVKVTPRDCTDLDVPGRFETTTPLLKALYQSNGDTLANILLDKGADPCYHRPDSRDLLDAFRKNGEFAPEFESTVIHRIEKLLETCPQSGKS